MSLTKAEADPEAFSYLQSVDTPTLSNAIELLKLRPQTEGFTSLGTRCLFPELGRMVGYAVTAHIETMTSGPNDRNMYLSLYDAVAQSPKPVVVAFQEIGPHRDYAAHCGEVMSTIFQRLGAVGLLTDSAVRDIPEVRAMKFKYFARGIVASHAYSRIVRIGVPIHIDGLVINQNDILHGDENGLISVPRQALEGLPKAVEQVRSREKALLDFVRGPNFNFDGLRNKILE